MIEINIWMAQLIEQLKCAFGSRLLFVGLQGSYRRREAHKDSDIDAVVILDVLSTEDLIEYRNILATMPENDKACGFVSGREELQSWPKHELFQFANDTDSLYGALETLLPAIGQSDIIDSVKIGASGLYHASCHTAIHNPKDMNALKALFKGSFFLLQAVYYLRSARYISSKRELLPLLCGNEREILDIQIKWNEYEADIAADPDAYLGLLINLCADLLKTRF